MSLEHKGSAKKAANKNDNYCPGPQSPLATVRDPVKYTVGQAATVSVADGYDGFVVLLPIPDQTGPIPHGWQRPWFKRVLYGTAEAGAVTFVPTDSRVIIIDYMDGFEPTPVNLHYYANWFEANYPGGGPQPGGTPVVT